MVKRHVRHVPSANRPPPLSRIPNRLLAALPSDDYDRISRTLGAVPLTLKQILHRPGEPVTEVYFPGDGFCSVLTVLEDGDMVEVATVGREGMVGVSAVLKDGPSVSATMVQAETKVCHAMAAQAFRDEMDRRGAFYNLLTRYAHALVGIVMQSTACNAVHSVEQRLSRWLLLAHDRVGRDEFPLTQEFVAMMLGATRPTVTVVAGTLQRAGLITYHRGQLTVVDREKLEAASCECYRVTTDLVSRVYTDGS
jgi:CRP-like cAMP-binding protein